MRKRKLLTITAVVAACMCICWGATVFADPPSTAAQQTPDPGKTGMQTPPDSLGATAGPVLGTVEALPVPPKPSDGGGEPGEPGEPGGPRQGNDACPATVIAALPYTDSGTTVGMVNNYTTCIANTAPDVIYEYTATAAASLTASLCGSAYDTVLEVRTGGACPGTTQVPGGCNDDFCGLQSEVTWTATTGTTYYIIVDGYAALSGAYTLNVTSTAPPTSCLLVYNNVGGTFYWNANGTPTMLTFGDDVLLDPLQPGLRVLCKYTVEVYRASGTGHTVTAELYTRSGAIPGVPIAGTSYTWNNVGAGVQVLTTPVFPPGIILPNSLYVVYTLSNVGTASVGPLIGEHAELPVPPPEGTENFFAGWTGSAWATYWFGSTGPWSGFRIRVNADPLSDNGACCVGMACTPDQTQAQCDALGGTFFVGQSCTPNICKGACCNPLDGSCTEVANAAACTAPLLWQGAGTVCTPNPCYTRPPCPADTLWGQQPRLPGESGNSGTSDLASTYNRADYYENVYGSICDVHWWGLTLRYSGGWLDCPTEVPMTFDITFYAHDAVTGLPGAVVATRTVSVTGVATGLTYSGFPMYYFSATVLNPCVYQATGWVGIQGTSVGTPNDCWFLWASSPQGNGTAALKTGTGPWAVDTYDRAVCLTGSSATVYGACCDDSIPQCYANQSQINCQPPNRFGPNQTCAQLDPPCGPGACCYGPSGARVCVVNTQAQCSGLNGDWYGSGTTCTPNPCVGACCLPNYGGCVQTDQLDCEVNLGGTWTNYGTACTPDPCPQPPQPGDTCETAILITGPGTYAGNTCSSAHDYNAVCPYTPTGAKDLVYRYTPASNICIDLTMCTGTTNYDTKLYIYASACTGTTIACNDDACANPPIYDPAYASRLTGVNLTGGTTYYIIVDGYEATDCGDYTLAITTCGAPCDVTCPPGSIPEGEPVCADNYTDATNGGCNSTPTVFSPIACNTTVCGTSGTYLFGTANYRDTDWYQIVTTVPTVFTWSATAEFPLLIFAINGTPGCGGLVILNSATAVECALATVTTAQQPAGTYWFWVGPSVFTGVPCGKEYWATLTTVPCGGAATGACCTLSGGCTVTTQADCAAPALWQGAGTTCTPNPCPTYCATCRGDVSGNSVRNGGDVQAFVNCVIAGGISQPCACADMNMDGAVTMADVSLFVTALLATPQPPCP